MPQHDDIERRLLDIELLASHQEMAIHDLSDMVARQWQTLDSLQRKLDCLEEQINEKNSSLGDENDSESPPPHY